jgi:hypothetical protein
MALVLFAGIGLICINLLVGRAGTEPSSARAAVSITPSNATMFAGEAVVFAATVAGINNKAVDWAVQEENGETITDSGLYTAPKIQGVHNLTTTSKRTPQVQAFATVTVLTYCDPLLPPLRR